MTTIISGNTPSTIGNDTTISGDITADNLPANGSIVGYQQGTWTATLSAGNSSNVSSLDSQSDTTWVRTGNQVTFWATVITTTTNGDYRTDVRIALSGLPYERDGIICGGGSASGGSNRQAIFNLTSASSETDTIFLTYAGGVGANVNDSSSLRLMGTYTTDNTDWTPINGATIS